MRDLRQQATQPQGNSTTFIYALIDPRTNLVRYIGKSDEPQKRLQRHLSARELRPETHKTHWLRELISAGCAPSILIIEEVNKCEWEAAETRWITYYRDILGDSFLTNTTSGGEGIDKGTKFSDTTRQKMSASQTGRHQTAESIAKIIATQKGKTLTGSHCAKLSEAQKRVWKQSSERERSKRLGNLYANLPTTKKECINISRRKKNPSGKNRCIGVIRTHGKYWQAATSLHGKRHYLGCYESEDEAGRAYDRFVIKHIGEGASLNFPLSDYK